jgi:hypothetical protein
MHVSKRSALAATAVAAVAFAVPALASPTRPSPNPGSGNHFPSTTQSFSCKDASGTEVGTVNLVGPDTLWPPNHKMIDENGAAINDNSSGDATLMLTVTPTDAVGGDGGPQHDPDYTQGSLMGSGTPEADVPFQVRAERSGKGDGRTYTIGWTATFNMMTTTCSSSDGKDGHAPFVISVPHDMGNNG